MSDLSIEHRADRVYTIIPGKLFQSGCNVSRADLPRSLDTIISVGDAFGPRQEGTSWYREWADDTSRVEPGRPQRPIFMHAPLIDSTRSGLLDKQASDAIARFAAQLLRCGRIVLIHCDAGMFRSVFITALVLHHFTREPAPKCLEMVRRVSGRRSMKVGVPEMDAMIEEAL